MAMVTKDLNLAGDEKETDDVEQRNLNPIVHVGLDEYERGADAKRFPMIMKDLARTYKIGFNAILDPKIISERADLVIKKISFSGVQKVDAVVFSRRIWCLWNESLWAMEFIKALTQCIHLCIKHGGNRAWILSIVYASPQLETRVAFWDELRNMASKWSLPRCLAGDFNLILYEYEKERGGLVNKSQLKNFANCIEDCRLIEVNMNGTFFTWKREEVKERLDKVLASNSGTEYFPEATVTSLALENSDHCRLWIKPKGQHSNNQETDFKFQSMWLAHEQFDKEVKRLWKLEVNWLANIEAFTQGMRKWNYEVFGDIFRKKKILILRIKGINNKLISQRNPFLTSLRQELWSEYE
ncbi:hypothetical protein RJT34_11415 [Clitoria ternatea]|uniref:Reverse transcriptase n=1 Tax=Clitoria ternatea TaxID=43366 RepID=A0AAN9JMN0_CLITE